MRSNDNELFTENVFCLVCYQCTCVQKAGEVWRELVKFETLQLLLQLCLLHMGGGCVYEKKGAANSN